MSTLEILKPILFPEGRIKGSLILSLILLVVLGDVVVESTGGTAYAFVHVMYLPILLGGFIFGIPGGVFTGLAAGFLMGPYMPTNIPNDLHQPFSSWVLRMVMYAFVGGLAGAGSSFLKSYVKELEERHIKDPLTGLYNIYGLQKIFSEFTSDSPQSLILLKLERLDEITQALGTERLNILLQSLGEKLKETFGKDCILAALSPHHFVIMVPEAQEKETLRQCEGLTSQSYTVQKIPVFLEMRFGVAHFPRDDEDLTQLIRKATLARREAENFGGLVSIYKPSTQDPSERNLKVLHHFKKALGTDQLYLEYQPQVNLNTGELKGFEALVRWKDSELGFVRPDEFIPLVEETLFIRPFSLWLIKEVLTQLEEWIQAGFHPQVCLNLSTTNLFDSEVKQSFLELLKAAKLPAHALGVEITETAVAKNIPVIVSALKDFRKAGVSISIDDYGTGQASQQYLFEFPLDGLKIDKIFVQGLGKTPAANAIVKNAISLAQEMDLQVVAEGVETQDQLDQLKAWGCPVGQGYYFSPSLSVEDATNWLKKNPQTKAAREV